MAPSPTSSAHSVDPARLVCYAPRALFFRQKESLEFTSLCYGPDATLFICSNTGGQFTAQDDIMKHN